MEGLEDTLALPVPFWLYLGLCVPLVLIALVALVRGFNDLADLGELAGAVASVIFTPLLVLVLLWGGNGVVQTLS